MSIEQEIQSKIVEVDFHKDAIQQSYEKFCKKRFNRRGTGEFIDLNTFWLLMRYSPVFDTMQDVAKFPISQDVALFLKECGVEYAPSEWDASFDKDKAAISDEKWESNAIKITYKRHDTTRSPANLP